MLYRNAFHSLNVATNRSTSYFACHVSIFPHQVIRGVIGSFIFYGTQQAFFELLPLSAESMIYIQKSRFYDLDFLQVYWRKHFRIYDLDFLRVYWRKTFQFAVHYKNLHVLITYPPKM